jgi:Fe-S cluster assembly protein SufD
MIENFNLNNLENISLKEKNFREKSLELFQNKGFPNKRMEDWKFTDLNQIINENFEKLELAVDHQGANKDKKLINDFEHNSVELLNGVLKSSNFKYEETSKISILVYKEESLNETNAKNSLINLNNALSEGGFSLEVSSGYKFKKPLIVYNYFDANLQNKIINNKNRIILKDDSDLNLVEIYSNSSENKFVHNNCTRIFIGKNSSFNNYTVQSSKCNGFYYKYVKVSQSESSKYTDCIFSSGVKFKRIEQDIDINGENAECDIQSALFLDVDCQQEVKTLINHLKPNCKSYQKIKNVLNKNCKSAYQGKIFVKDIAQKTDAYQLSKALLLEDSSEFNAKPELEIYADDVKCSHGSTSGSMNEDSIYYLMTRGISKKDAKDLLTKAFLFEIANSISDTCIKKFIEKNLDRQIYGY